MAHTSLGVLLTTAVLTREAGAVPSLLAAMGSPLAVVEPAEAVPVTGPVAGTVKRTVYTCEVPDASEPLVVNVTVLPATVPPPVTVTPVGAPPSTSCAVTPVAVLGPWLVSSTEYTMLEPGVAATGPLAEMATSATWVAVTVAVAAGAVPLLLAALVSRSEVADTVPTRVPLAGIVTRTMGLNTSLGARLRAGKVTTPVPASYTPKLETLTFVKPVASCRRATTLVALLLPLVLVTVRANVTRDPAGAVAGAFTVALTSAGSAAPTATLTEVGFTVVWVVLVVGVEVALNELMPASGTGIITLKFSALGVPVVNGLVPEKVTVPAPEL